MVGNWTSAGKVPSITQSLGKGLYRLENGKEVLDRVCGIHLKAYKKPHASLV